MDKPVRRIVVMLTAWLMGDNPVITDSPVTLFGITLA